MRRPFARALREVRTSLARGYDPSTYTGRRLRQLESNIVNILDLAMSDAHGVLTQTLGDVIQAENKAITGILKDELPHPVDTMITFGRIPIEHVEQMIDEPVGGVKYTDRLATIKQSAYGDAKASLTTSVLLGEGMHKAAKRLQGVVDKHSYYNAVRLARTEIQRVANQASRRVYDRHKGLLRGIAWQATFDNRTCPDCGELDGKEYYYEGQPNVDDAPDIPLHPMCRCTMVPLTSSWKDLGFSKQDLAGFPGLAALDKGQGRPMVYGDWFKRQDPAVQRQILGKKRYAEYKKGKYKPFKHVRQATGPKTKPLSPRKLGDLRGMGKKTKPKKPLVPKRKAFTTKEVEGIAVPASAMKARGFDLTEVDLREAKRWYDKKNTGPIRRTTLLQQLREVYYRKIRPRSVNKGMALKEAREMAVAYVEEVRKRAAKLIAEATALRGPVTLAQVKKRIKAEYSDSQIQKLASEAGVSEKDLRKGLKDLHQSILDTGCGAVVSHIPENVSLVLGSNSVGDELRGCMYPDTPYITESVMRRKFNYRVETPTNSGSDNKKPDYTGFSVVISTHNVAKLGAATSQHDRASAIRTLIHELGHCMEITPEINKRAVAFLTRRAEGETPTQEVETRYRDKFYQSYTGKIYPRDTEILSTAVHYIPALMVREPVEGLAETTPPVDWVTYDPEHFSFMLNELAGLNEGNKP